MAQNHSPLFFPLSPGHSQGPRLGRARRPGDPGKVNPLNQSDAQEPWLTSKWVKLPLLLCSWETVIGKERQPEGQYASNQGTWSILPPFPFL